MMQKLKITSVNICGLNAEILKRVSSPMNKLIPDILMIQETLICNESNIKLNSRKFPYQYYATGNLKARGTSILINKNWRFQVKNAIKMLGEKHARNR